MTRFMIALGAKRYRLERELGKGSARFVALHPDSLAQILELGELHYRDNTRSFVELIGLEFVADRSLPRGYVEVRPVQPTEASTMRDARAGAAGQAHLG